MVQTLGSSLNAASRDTAILMCKAGNATQFWFSPKAPPRSETEKEDSYFHLILAEGQSCSFEDAPKESGQQLSPFGNQHLSSQRSQPESKLLKTEQEEL
jgi:hypothetical protein